MKRLERRRVARLDRSMRGTALRRAALPAFDKLLLSRPRDHVLEIRLNNPAKLNCFDVGSFGVS